MAEPIPPTTPWAFPPIPQYNFNIKYPALFEAMNKLKRQGLYYYRREIVLDGLVFEECSFENCRFITNKGTFSLIKCRIYGPATSFLYGEQALKVARFYEFMNFSVLGRIVFPNLAPQFDEGGRISV